jgi:hypothetical protein
MSRAHLSNKAKNPHFWEQQSSSVLHGLKNRLQNNCVAGANEDDGDREDEGAAVGTGRA